MSAIFLPVPGQQVRRIDTRERTPLAAKSGSLYQTARAIVVTEPEFSYKLQRKAVTHMVERSPIIWVNPALEKMDPFLN